MSKVYEYFESRNEICKSCDDVIPEWSFICPVCFCKWEDGRVYDAITGEE